MRFRLPKFSPKVRADSSRKRLTVEPLEQRRLLSSDSTVVFNEIQYNPAGTDETLEFIELYNQLSYDLDLSGWKLDDAVDFPFPVGTSIGSGQLLVIAKDPAALEAATGTSGVLGPYTGSLSNGGENVELRNNNDRLMDSVEYNDRGDWPIAADGSGASLAKIDPSTTGSSVDAWAASVQVGGTPGAQNFAANGQGTAIVTTTLVPAGHPTKAIVPADGGLALDWTGGDELFDDSSWAVGTSGVGFDADPRYGGLIGTDVQSEMLGVNTSALTRIAFDVADPGAPDELTLRMKYDDGFLAYLNGQEVASRNAPAAGASSLTIVSHYRLGEDDPGAVDGGSATAGTSGVAAVGVNLNLANSGSVNSQTYTSDTPGPESTLATTFDGDDGYWSPTLPSTRQDNFGIEAWAKFDNATDPVGWIALNGLGGTGWGIVQVGGQVLGHYPGVGNIGSASITPGAWTHLALVRDGGTAMFYVNGVAAGPTSTATPNPPNGVLEIGYLHLSGDKEWFEGAIDDVRVFEFDSGTFNINDTLVGGVPEPTGEGQPWNAAATAENPAEQAVVYEDIDLTGFLGELQQGDNELAIHGLNLTVDDGDFLVLPELVGSAAGVPATLVPPGAAAETLIPGDDSLGHDWTQATFDDSGPEWISGTTGVGFDTQIGYDGLIGLDLENEMFGVNAGAFVRSAFDVSDPAVFDTLTLDVKYDDGFVAYLNGREIARRNAPSPPPVAVHYRLGDDDPGAVAGNPGNATSVAAVGSPTLDLTLRTGSPAYSSDTPGAASSLSMEFDPGEYYATNGTLPTTATDNFGIEAWVTRDSFTGNQGIAWNGDSGWGLYTMGTDILGHLNGVADVGTGGATVPVGTWFHVAMVRDSGTTTLYVNGIPNGTTHNGTPAVPTGSFWVGQIGGAPAGFESDGKVDDVRVFTFEPGTFSTDDLLLASATPQAELPLWDSPALGQRPDEQAIIGQRIDVSQFVDRLRSGTNILAIHGLNAAVDDGDFLVAPELHAGRTVELPRLTINETAAADDSAFFVEISNQGGMPIELTGYVLSATGISGGQFVFPEQTLDPGGFFAVAAGQLGFQPADGERLFLFDPDQTSVLDAVVVDDQLRGRSAGQGTRWLYPDAPTPDVANSFTFHDDVVINEIMYHGLPDFGSPGTPATFDTTTLIDFGDDWTYSKHTEQFNAGINWDDDAHPVDNVNWFRGPGPFGYENDPLPLGHAIGTQFTDPRDAGIDPYIFTYYFETEFTLTQDDLDNLDSLLFEHVVDDGAVFYLNGREIAEARFKMPAGMPNFLTTASSGGESVSTGPLVIGPEALVVGTNRLSVEVHQINDVSSDVVFAAKLQSVQGTDPGTPGTTFTENPQEWIELYNRGIVAVDLRGWTIRDAIEYDFDLITGPTIGPGEYLVVAKDPVAMAADYGVNGVLGPYSRRLSNGNDRILLYDGAGNPADEVHYYDGGQWDGFADGFGASLELVDPRADNSIGGAWSASDETAKPANGWQTITRRGTIGTPLSSVLDRFDEFQLGLFGAGQLLLDDVQVRRDPLGANVNVLQDGDFELGGASWRLQGTHGHSRIVVDPDDPANHVLHLVATGPMEYFHNLVETTFSAGNTIQTGQTYEISYRVKWLRGSSQLNTRLYFDHLAQTTIIDVSPLGGTPGTSNSVFAANAGPNYRDLRHQPAVPAPGEAVTVSVAATDPDTVASMTLHWAVDGGTFAPVTMTPQGDGVYAAQVPGQTAGTIVQFYVEGRDGLNATATFPAEGGASRAMFIVDDGLAATDGRNNFRIIMKDADLEAMFVNEDLMSNDRIGATVIFNEAEFYYDVGTRLKGSTRGRHPDFGDAHGYNLQFAADRLFRGAHETVAVDRSNRTPSGPNGVDEIIAKHMINHAGGIPGMIDDIVHLVVATRPQDNQSSLLMMARYDDTYLDSQFNNGSDGGLFEWDVIYAVDPNDLPTPESPKPPWPSGFFQSDLTDKGDDKERYRWSFLAKNNRRADDYDAIIAMNKAMGLSGSFNGSTLDLATQQAIDVDQWMRSFAAYRLFGINDTYTSNLNHNLAFYTRPSDGKVLAMPQDMDFVFGLGATVSLQRGGTNLDKLINIPNNRHYYLGHMHDIINTTFNTGYMDRWLQHYSDVVPEQNFTGGAYAGYIDARNVSVLSQLPGQVAFDVTTPVGSIAANGITLEGNGWINVRELRLAGSTEPLDVVWTTETAWEAVVPLSPGENDLVIEAFDFQGQLLDSDMVSITSTITNNVVDFLRISEIMYHPADPATEGPEVAFTDDDDFEYVELVNTGTVDLDISGVSFSNGIQFTFPADTSLPHGERILVVRNLAAFETRYGTGMTVAGEYQEPTGGNKLDNGGETIRLEDGVGAVIQEFAYNDSVNQGWPAAADGSGSSLEAVNFDDGSADPATWNDYGDSTLWYASPQHNGSPGEAATAAVLQRHVFYGGSSFGNAIATDKTAFLPGDNATIENITNYSGGINGLIVDLAHAPGAATLAIADLGLAVGNNDDPTTWMAASEAALDVLTGGGRGGSDRLVITWAENAPKNTWLEVTIPGGGGHQTTTTGLAIDDVFYFGNAAGDTGNSQADTLVNAADVIAIRDHPRGQQNPAAINDPYDLNRDRSVDAVDLILARDNATSPLSALQLIEPPAASPAPPAAAEGRMFPPAGEGESTIATGSLVQTGTSSLESLDGLMATQVDQLDVDTLLPSTTLSKLLRRFGPTGN